MGLDDLTWGRWFEESRHLRGEERRRQLSLRWQETHGRIFVYRQRRGPILKWEQSLPQHLTYWPALLPKCLRGFGCVRGGEQGPASMGLGV